MLMLEAPVGLALFGPDMRFRWVNAALKRLGGQPGVDGSNSSGPAHPTPPGWAGLLPSQAWPESIATRAENALRQVLAEGVPLAEGGYPVLDKAGPDVDAAQSGPATSGCASWFPVHDAAGRVFGVGLIMLNMADLSAEAAEAAAAISRSEERYRSLVQGGAQVIWVTAPDGAMKEDSPEWRWITGQSVEDFTGFGWLNSIHPEDRERVERDWRECVRSGKVFDDRYRIRTKGGSYRHYDVRAVPIERDGRIVEWVGANTDVTSQREAEEMRGRLTEQLSAAALRTARLQQATSMLAEALTVEQVVEVITEVGRTAIGALRSAVALLEADGTRLRVVNDDLRDAPDSAGGQLTLESPSVMTKAIATRRPVLVEDPEDLRRQFEGELEIDPERVAASDERSWVGLPLLAAGAPLGALRFSFGRPRKITEEERVFLEALAGQCQLAVERAGLYEREHTTAETLQRSLLPDQLPSVPGLVLGAMYRPAKKMEIGGDWYDAFRLADQRLGVAVGDVMGKGLTAAAGMGRVRNALRALALTDPRPAAVLGGLDRLFSATEQDEQVTTLAYLVIDPETGEGLIGNAGHLPALVLEAGYAPRFCEVEEGTPLGVPSPRKQRKFSLRPGSTAVFYSDGLVENRKRGLDKGLEELAALAARADEDLLAQPERLLEYLVEHMLAGHEQDDDVTVLVMHVPAGGPL
jgi:PAS domain S-box-containing protein